VRCNEASRGEGFDVDGKQREIRLSEKDALTVVQLLEALERLVRSTELDERCRDLLAASGMAALERDGWQARMAGEASAASGAIRQLLDGYDPSSAIAAGSPAGVRVD
jgi:hypothetical protein